MTEDKSMVLLFQKDQDVITVPREQVKLAFEKARLPCIGFFNDEKNVGIVQGVSSEDDVFYININKNNVYAYSFFDDADVPEKVGAELYITTEGKLTKTKGSNKKVGMFLQNTRGAILFKLD